MAYRLTSQIGPVSEIAPSGEVVADPVLPKGTEFIIDEGPHEWACDPNAPKLPFYTILICERRGGHPIAASAKRYKVLANILEPAMTESVVGKIDAAVRGAIVGSTAGAMVGTALMPGLGTFLGLGVGGLLTAYLGNRGR